MPARASRGVVWALAAAIVGLTAVEYFVLLGSGDHVLIQWLLVLLAILAVAFAAITTRSPPRAPTDASPPAEPASVPTPKGPS